MVEFLRATTEKIETMLSNEQNVELCDARPNGSVRAGNESAMAALPPVTQKIKITTQTILQTQTQMPVQNLL